MKRTWSSILMIFIAALIVIVAIDRSAAHISPPVNRREAEDGIRDLANSNPDVLVLGSSHARTLHVLGQELAARTNGRQSLVAIPVENGKISVYDWTLQHRLRRLLEEKRPDGRLVRDRISRFILITEWWDSCAPHENSRFNYWNLPSRAWAFGDFSADVAQNGINGYNRNYLQNRVRRMLSQSALVFDRTNSLLVKRTMDFIRGRPLGRSPEEELEQLHAWQRNVEVGISCMGDTEQINAMRSIIRYATSRGMRPIILLFPRKPATLTAKGKSTTIAGFHDLMERIASEENADLVDLTTSAPLTDDDFMEDFDHVNSVGNAKFANWALDKPLHFLMDTDVTNLAGVGQ